MTDIERKALALLNEVEAERSTPDWEDVCRSSLTSSEALCRAIERHEAFRQEVSDAVEAYIDHDRQDGWLGFDHFIIAKPDPLVEALTDVSGEGGFDNYDHMAHRLHQALAARGLKITNI